MFSVKSCTIIFWLAIATANAKGISNDSTCPQICPDLYSPVCAHDGINFKQFVNPCELEIKNCQLQQLAAKLFSRVNMAWCTSTFVENLREKLNNIDLQRPECLKPCALIYAPVCVSDGKYRALVSNECEMEFYNCALFHNNATAQLFKVLRRDSC